MDKFNNSICICLLNTLLFRHQLIAAALMIPLSLLPLHALTSPHVSLLSHDQPLRSPAQTVPYKYQSRTKTSAAKTKTAEMENSVRNLSGSIRIQSHKQIDEVGVEDSGLISVNNGGSLTFRNKFEISGVVEGSEIDPEKIRSQFLQVLSSRRTAEVPLRVEAGKPVKDPIYQGTVPSSRSEEMESCPKENITNFKELLIEENLYLYTEAGEQGRVPLLILSIKQIVPQKRPAIVFLHSTGKCKEWLLPLLEVACFRHLKIIKSLSRSPSVSNGETVMCVSCLPRAYASRGYITIGIDSRYHGERATNNTTYRDALISSWKNGDTMPFIYDTVWDLIKLADYLSQREDIDPNRIGITGESLGGMHAWFAAAADTRYSVVVPIIGVQGFRWAIDNDKWQGRVDSLKPLFEEARIDLKKRTIDKQVVEKVWDRIAPGLASQFDSPKTIPIIAPRPLLILNGVKDPRCPLEGIRARETRAAYEKAHCSDKFQLIAEPGVGHHMTSLMVNEASEWFDRFLK